MSAMVYGGSIAGVPTTAYAAHPGTIVHAAPTTAYAAAPTTTVVQAAAPTTFAAAPVTTVVQPAAVHAAPALLQHPGAVPVPPADIMAGTATPADVNNQKAVFHASIDQQQKTAEALLMQQHQAQLANLNATTEHAKQQFAIQKDQELAAQKAQMEIQFRAQLHQLADTARTQKHGLEVQAAQLTADYEHVAKTHQLNQEKHAAEKRHYDAQIAMQGEMARLQQQAATVGR
jgi:hypothetical protein